MFNFGNAVKTFLGNGFLGSDRRKIIQTYEAKNKIRQAKGRKTFYEIPNGKDDASILYSEFVKLAKEFGDNFGEDFSSSELEILYNTGVLPREFEIDGRDYEGLNKVLFVENARSQGKDLERAMQERFARNLKNSLLPWIRFFSLLCKNGATEQDVKVYIILLRIILRENYNWGRREKNDRTEFPVFHPRITPMVIQQAKTMMLSGKGAQKYKDWSELLHQLHLQYFWQEKNDKNEIQEDVGKHLWLTYPTSDNLTRDEIKIRTEDTPDLGILCSPIQGLCLGGGAVGYGEYLSKGKMFILGKVELMKGQDGKDLKFVSPKVICFVDHSGNVQEFRGTGAQQELTGAMLSQLELTPPAIPNWDRYIRLNFQAILNSIRIEPIVKKLLQKKPLTASEYDFVMSLPPNSPTLGTRTIAYYQKYLSTL